MRHSIGSGLGVATLLSLAAGFEGLRPLGDDPEPVPEAAPESIDPERTERVARIRVDAEERRRRRNARRLAQWRNGEAYEVRGAAERAA